MSARLALLALQWPDRPAHFTLAELQTAATHKDARR